MLASREVTQRFRPIGVDASRRAICLEQRSTALSGLQLMQEISVNRYMLFLQSPSGSVSNSLAAPCRVQ
jgi:hypothetical protein